MHRRSPGFLSFKSTHTQIQRTLSFNNCLFCFVFVLLWMGSKQKYEFGDSSSKLYPNELNCIHYNPWIHFNSIFPNFPMIGFLPRLSFRIVDYGLNLGESHSFSDISFTTKSWFAKKKPLKFCFYFVLFIYAHPNFPVWLFLFHSRQMSWVSLSLVLQALMNWWINQFSIHFSPIQFNLIQLISF